jgi:hypothetical protein
MNYESLAGHLEDSLGLKQGVSLFINMMPTSIDTGVVVKAGFAGTAIDGEIPSLRKGRFQIAVRSSVYATAKALAEDVSASLTLTNVLLTGMEVKSIRPLTEPIPYQPSVGGYVEFSVSFQAIYGIVA